MATAAFESFVETLRYDNTLSLSPARVAIQYVHIRNHRDYSTIFGKCCG